MQYKRRRIKGLNRKVFYKNLKSVLKPEYIKNLKYDFEKWVDNYEENVNCNGRYGLYCVSKWENKYNYAVEIRTN